MQLMTNMRKKNHLIVRNDLSTFDNFFQSRLNMSNKPIIHWTDEQIEQISNNYARYIMQMFQDEIVQAKLYDFIAFNHEFNASTITIEIKYFPYDLTEEELKQYPNNPKVLNFKIFADGTLASPQDFTTKFTTQELEYFPGYLADTTYFFSKLDYSEK